MKLSVPCTFEPGSIDRLCAFASVAEVYGRREGGWIGSGRTSYTLRHASRAEFQKTLAACVKHGIAYNYLLNASSLHGMEQTRAGQRRIRATLDGLCSDGIVWVTVALPWLLELIRRSYPSLKVKIGVFAQIDTAEKARQWEALGAHALCISAIACNRDFETLAAMRASVTCDLQLIANAACTPFCLWEHTHMDLLTSSSRRGDPHGGLCLDYCYLKCSSARLREPVRFIRSVWIRPEDLAVYEALGYTWFKIVERSCPTELLIRRVAAYDSRRFDGNLWELVGPVARVPLQPSTPLSMTLRAVKSSLRPWEMNPRRLKDIAEYAAATLVRETSPDKAPVYIDNRALDGFVDALKQRGCTPASCGECDHCAQVAQRVVRMDPHFREETLARAGSIADGLYDGSLWW
jgi:collagenase-like PrtC family protease